MCLAGTVFASAARADGDPASDYLLTQRVFFTSGSASESESQRQLVALVAAADRAGFPIRVAIIADEYDLGSITALWRKPRVYARFLGIELSASDPQRLLVVMPNGVGFDWPGHPSLPEYRLLAHLPIGSGAAALATAARTAVRRLAVASNIQLVVLPTGSASRNRSAGSFDWLLVVVIVLSAICALVGAIALRRHRSARPTRRGATDIARAPRLQPRVAIPGFAALVVVAIGTPLVLTVRSRDGGTASVNAGSIVTPPAVSWPAGRRPAPDFVLRDQNGRPVSISEFRGRPVILTFADPLCRNLCPLEAHLLNHVVGSIPVRDRPAIIAVSVDVYADKQADLIQDEHKWGLIPQWHWAVGRPAQLADVWRSYRIGVSIVRKRIDNTTINYITHVEAAYVIDATGHERALFGWPFYPQDLEHVLRQLR